MATEQTSDRGGALERVQRTVREFGDDETDVTALDRVRTRVRQVHSSFVRGDWADRARRMGPVFWLPAQRAHAVFLHADAALFCVPTFTQEALARQPERFTARRLPQTVRTTSGFLLDAFGWDRRTETPRPELYWPSVAIRMAHAERRPDKARISEAAMAYFAFQLVRAAEHPSPHRGDNGFERLCADHFDYWGNSYGAPSLTAARSNPLDLLRCEQQLVRG